MQHMVTYVTGMYYHLYEISSEIQILIFDTYLPEILYLREQGSQARGYFSKPKGARELKFSETLYRSTQLVNAIT